MNRTILAATLIIAAGTTLALWPRDQAWTDGRGIRRAAAGAPLRQVLWQPAEPLRAAGDEEYEPRLSADGTVMVLVRGRPGHNADLFTSRWSPKGWSPPEPISAVNTDRDELGPELSADGRLLYFYSDRPGGLGGYDLWVSSRTDGAWGSPVNLGPSVNTAWNEYGPAVSPDGSRVYFASNRPRPDEPPTTPETWAATARERRTRHDYDLFSAALDEGKGVATGPAEPVLALNTGADEAAPAVSPGGDFLYFTSDRAGGRGGFDLYRARVAVDRTVGAAENLGDAVNSAGNDLDPALSAAGFRLTFSSDRRRADGGDAPAATDTSPRYALWTSTSREVFRELGPRVSMGPLWPRLLMLLAALAPLLLLAYLLRHPSWRSRLGRMSLLAQCIAVSLILHAVIASLLAVWKVGSGILDSVRSGGGNGTRVFVSSAPPGGGAGSISAQLQGAVADAAIGISELAPQDRAAPATPPVRMTLADAGLPTAARVEVAAAEPPRARRAPERPAVPASTAAPAPDAGGNTTARLPESATPSAAATEAAAGGPTLGALAPASPSATALRGDEASLPAVAVPAAAPSAGAVAARGNSPAPDPTATTPAPARGGPRSLAEGIATPGTPAAAPSPTPEPSISTPGLAALGVGGAPAAPVPAVPGSGEVAPLPSLVAPAGGPGSGLAAPTPSARVAEGPGTAAPEVGRAATPGGPAGAAAALPSVRPSTGPAAESPVPGAGLDMGVSPAAPAITAPAGMPAGGGSTPGPSPELPALTAPAGAGLTGPGPRRSVADGPAGPSSGAVLPAPPAETVGGGDLPIPKETFAQRRAESRGELLEKMGGGADTERAVGLALEWFRRHQSADGRWSSRRFDEGCGACPGAAEVDADVGMTSLTLLCYLGAGHTHLQEGPYREVVARGLAWLRSRQGADGDLRGREAMYSQTVAAVALCEAYAMTRDASLAGPAQKAVDLVLRRTVPGAAARDTSVLGWLVFTVESARRAGLTVPSDPFERAAAWLDGTSDPSRTGRYAYGPGKPASAPMTAEAMFVQQLLGHRRDEARMEASARFIAATPPSWSAGAPTHHWYYATLALFQHQGEAWSRWNEGLKRELLGHQHATGPDSGSWDPQDETSRLVGRVYQTAVCTLSLEVYYRYRTAPAGPGPGAPEGGLR